MFDKQHFHIRSVRESVTENVNVTVKNAPTTESAKLLKELEKEALDKVIGSLHCAGNVFNVTGVFIKDDFNGPSLVGRYQLNGVEHKVEVKTKLVFDRDELIRDLFWQIANQIAHNLLIGTGPDVITRFMKGAGL